LITVSQLCRKRSQKFSRERSMALTRAQTARLQHRHMATASLKDLSAYSTAAIVTAFRNSVTSSSRSNLSPIKCSKSSRSTTTYLNQQLAQRELAHTSSIKARSLRKEVIMQAKPSRSSRRRRSLSPRKRRRTLVLRIKAKTS